MTAESTDRLRTVLQLLETLPEAPPNKSVLSDDEAALASKVLASACRWYYRAAQGRGAADFAGILELSTSEACVVATAMLHSQSLSPFEFGIWFVAAEARE